MINMIFEYGVSSMALLVIAAGITISAIFWRTFFKKSRYPFPPSPPGEPILGHIRLVPTDDPHLYYQKLSQQYSTDILYFKQFLTPVVVLNTVKAADELLSRKGANYCDRPRFVLFEVMGWGRTLTFLPWGSRFKAHRTHLQTAFTKTSVVQYREIQEHEARQALHTIAQRPDDWEIALRRFASAIVLRVAFGITLKNDDDEYIKIAADAINATGNGGSPGATVIDYFPFLGNLPRWLVPSRAITHARNWGYAIKRLHDVPFAAARKDFNEGVAQSSSYVYPLLERYERKESQHLPNDFAMEDINGSAAAIFIAGSDTTFATTLVGILNLLLNPTVFHKARSLLDQTIGLDRLPSLKDREHPDLLYVEYIVQEIVRWRPLSPLGVPHKSLEDDIYNEMFIPQGTNVFFNTWAMSRDETIYKDPDSFNPDRYIPVEQGGAGEPYLKGPFGFGRRICVGRHLALASVWIVLATLISTVDISKAVDSNGEEIEPVVGFTTGLSSHPLHFDCKFTSRSEATESLLGSSLL
ncbi:hypothetical protein BCIN_08g00560 [Botrytis cinerea B05.10]|uniref:Cytochrome P450 n=1 Tax=Botryotinia fuckeliana (strain B05.10) TaxID=332648 RepID=A0A384JNY6_BOTFB|nr:hypothetical protein BCIN_08g00560 [Botrytis cinerea B05.10]ATZ52299.1 hypothetical protein BCIN_08g00560 [Botrytis cinerea B05.10]